MALQMAMFAPKSEWVPPAELPNIFDAKKIAIDVETRDPDLKSRGPGWPTGNGEVVGYAVATEDWSGYLPINHLGGGNLDARLANKWLKKVFECPADKIMHNAQYDAGWIKQMGFDINGRIIDTMLIASLIDENRFSYSLNALAYDYLNKTKAEMWKMPAQFLGPYAEVDAELTLELWAHFSAELGKQELWPIANLELDLLPCLVDMTFRGVRVDLDRAEQTRVSILKKEKEVLGEIKKLVGTDVEIWAAQSLAKAFDAVGIRYPQTEKGAPSFTKAFLQEHPEKLPRLITQARNLNKTSGTFITNMLNHCHKDGRIHSHINQVRYYDGGTVSGRISMNNPNLQQIPARDPEIGPLIRSLFLPEEDQKWAAIDYSQQEPRILVHYASVFGKSRGAELAGAAEFVEAYNSDPETDFHSLVAEMAGISRKQAKVVNLAMMYGMGVTKLSEQLDIPVDEAKTLIRQYHDRVPFVKGLQKGVINRLDSKSSSGSVRSILGRKCRFDTWEPDTFAMNKALPYREAVQEYGETTRLKRAYTYKALNRLIQASAADVTKKAMVDIYKTGRVPMIQIHDEIAMSVTGMEEAKEISKIMVDAVPLCVPSKCDIEIGDSWGEAK